MHEVLHALGLSHEHTRSDRDSFLTIHFENIAKGREGNFNKRNYKDKRKTFDFMSVMLYGPDAFSANKLPTISSRIAGQSVLTSQEKPQISDGDVQQINLMYCK